MFLLNTMIFIPSSSRWDQSTARHVSTVSGVMTITVPGLRTVLVKETTAGLFCTWLSSCWCCCGGCTLPGKFNTVARHLCWQIYVEAAKHAQVDSFLVSSGQVSGTRPRGSCGCVPTACCWLWPCWWLCSHWSCCFCLAHTSTWFLSTLPPGSSCRAIGSPTSSTAAQMKTPSTAAPSITCGVSSACGAQWSGNRCTSGRAATKSSDTWQALNDKWLMAAFR